VADAYSYRASGPDDCCTTADVPPAAALVAKGLAVLDPRGELDSPDTVGERLAMHDLMTGLREAGVATEGPPPFGPQAKHEFAALFDRVLARALRRPTCARAATAPRPPRKRRPEHHRAGAS
jgi:hypothetical protein